MCNYSLLAGACQWGIPQLHGDRRVNTKGRYGSKKCLILCYRFAGVPGYVVYCGGELIGRRKKGGRGQLVGNGNVALITGASSGIGAAFAEKLAAQGHDLVLVARREDRLKTLAAEMQERNRVSVEVLAADLSCPAGVEKVEAYVTGLPGLEFLINGAGFGTSGHFAEIDLEKQVDMIHVHVLAPVRLCRAALQGMIALGRGSIINVSSVAAFWPLPENANYAASKAYLAVFSQALAAELRGTGVRVQALCPGFTYTEFHDTSEFEDFDRNLIPEPLWMTPEELVTMSLKALEQGKTMFVPGWKNRLMVSGTARKLTSLVPRGWIRHMMRRK